MKWYQVLLFWAFLLAASESKSSVPFPDKEEQVSGIPQGRSAQLSSGYSALAGECLTLPTNKHISVSLENCNHYHNCCLLVCLPSPSVYKSSANTQFNSLPCTQKDFFLSRALKILLGDVHRTWMWHSVPWGGWHSGDWAEVGLDDPGGLFQQ